ncbi:MAG: metal-sensing transcriptional repressor [Hallerella porci]|uniref:DNA-binding FrmR family transcriptional regulator n=2 Tax=Hallerella TaxID=2815788 RepID=A0ABX5LNP4_9BACT|nr:MULTISPECIES: metal-sensing transcriptional repressor [Hallerella]MCI5599890.1 metal-sensing transcriptional repressor [Hallerella sp.]MDY3920639.1 metal-sensing transcriptional repressor [Hallerella porci]PWL03557.1 DNA-binding FrmR family transcriptional regulator [Hallerella porci]
MTKNVLECMKCKVKHRDAAEKKKLMSRLNRIEGQIKGIKGMLEKDAYCPNILIQVSAVNAALNSFNKELLASHIQTCVVKHLRAGDESVVDELVLTLQKLMK